MNSSGENHSTANLSEFLQQKCRAQGWMKFSDYMRDALYHPQWGYYMQDRPIVGPAGDFVTAPHLGRDLAHSLFQASRPFLTRYGGDVLEWGAGDGVLSSQLLPLLANAGLLKTYWLIEQSPTMRQRQQTLLRERCPELLRFVRWSDRLPEHFIGLALANELLDALPVERLVWTGTQFKPYGIGMREGQLVEKIGPFDRQLHNAVRRTQIKHQLAWSVGYQCEYPVDFFAWWNSWVKDLKCGLVIFIDYGYSEPQYYHPQRHRGTLTCYRQQTIEPFLPGSPGTQDLTAHVNFSIVARAILAQGWHLSGFSCLRNFMVQYADYNSPTLKPWLVEPSMGDAMQVLAFSTERQVEIL